MIGRRDAMKSISASGAALYGLTIGVGCGGAAQRRAEHADASGELVANMYITVLPTSRVRLAMNKAEIGQGISTGFATLVAEELELSTDDVDVVMADSLPEYKTSGLEGVPLFALHSTGGSTSMREAFIPVRTAAAAAREMLVAAAAQRWRVAPDACRAGGGRVVHEASGRELSFGELTREAARQDVPDEPRLKAPGDFRHIGRPRRRVDLLDKVTGRTVYGLDVTVPGALVAVPIFAPVFGAAPRSVRASEARSMRGVVDVLSLPFGVAVVAEKYWQARAAAARVEVEWGTGAAEGLDSGVLAAAMRRHDESGTVVRDEGDAIGEIEDDPNRLEAVYEFPYLAQAPLEPQNATVAVGDDRVEVWAPCQIPTVVQEAIAEAIDVSADDVLVHTTFSGGGFGRRLLGDCPAQAAMVSERLGRPVKLVWSREDDMRQGFYRPAATVFVRGSGRGGRARAIHSHSLSQPIGAHQGHSTMGGLPSFLPTFLRSLATSTVSSLFESNVNPDFFATEGMSHTPYEIPHQRHEYTPVEAGIPVGFWRSVGHSFNAFAIESFLDEIAIAADRDPIALRLAMLPAGARAHRVLSAVKRLSEWGRAAPSGLARGVARHEAFGTEVAQVVEAGVVDDRIVVERVWCVVDCGIPVNPDVIVAQIEGAILFGLSAALDQEITFTAGRVQQDNYDSYPVLRMHETPEITVEVMPSSAPPTGIGEPGVPPIGPAVANAVARATGRRLRSLPLQKAWDRGRSR